MTLGRRSFSHRYEGLTRWQRILKNVIETYTRTSKTVVVYEYLSTLFSKSFRV